MNTASPPSRAALGIVMALAAAALFSVNGTVSKIVMAHGLSPLQLVHLRSIGAAVCLFALVTVVRPAGLRATVRELVFLAIYGVVGIALVQWFYFIAIARLPVGIALLLEFMAPLLVALWVRFVRGEQVRRRVWAALGLCLAGLALVAQIHTDVRLDGLGVLAGIGAAITLAAYFLLGERGLSTRDPLSLAAWIFAFSALWWTVVPPWQGLPFELLAADAVLPAAVGGQSVALWSLTAFVILGGTVVPYVLVLGAIGCLGPTRVGLIGTVEPVGAGLVAWLVLAEILDGAQLVGAALVLAGIVLAETSRRRRADAAAAPPLPEGVAP